MKTISFIFILVLAFGIVQGQKVKDVKLTNANDSISYAFGVSIADNLQKQEIENLNPLALARAFFDVYNKSTKMDVEGANTMIQKYFDTQEAKKFDVTIKEAKKFHEENGKKEGVVTTESGLQYKVIKEGDGIKPSIDDVVRVNYEGTLIDGTKFDSSYDRGEPAEFGLKQVISGWTEALQLMKEGSIYMIYLPADLAYGSRQAGELIKPFSSLIFKVELIKVIKQDQE
jgi:FKBP-type peptidyl-prolyl cis-trans isomerase FklB